MICALFVSVFTNTMVNVAVTQIRTDFGVSEGQVGWVITGYSLPYAVSIPLYGKITDHFSLRRTFVFAMGIFAVGLAVCSLASGLDLLVAGRALQGIGAGAIPALSFGSVAKMFAPGSRGVALGALSSGVGVGSAAGPVLGGLIVGAFDWHWLFRITLVLAVVILAVGFYVLPERIPGTAAGGATLGQLDLPGGLLLAAAAGTALLTVTQAETLGLSSSVVWVGFLIVAATAAGFAWRIRTAGEPFIPPQIFASRRFLAAAAAGFLASFANIGSLFLYPQMLENVNGLAPAMAGLVLAPGAVALAVLAPLAGRLSDKIGPGIVLSAGLVVMLAAAFFTSSFAAGASVVLVGGGILLVGMGFAGVNSPATNAASEATPREVAGTGLGVYQLFFFLGSGSGPAILGAFLASRRGAAGEALNPLYSLQAVPFSDAFLLTAAAAALALVVATSLIRRPKGREGA